MPLLFGTRNNIARNLEAGWNRNGEAGLIVLYGPASSHGALSPHFQVHNHPLHDAIDDTFEEVELSDLSSIYTSQAIAPTTSNHAAGATAQPRSMSPHSNSLLRAPPACTDGRTSFTSSATTLMDRNGGTVPALQADTLPEKKYGRTIRNLRYTWLTVYRRLYLLCLIPNVVYMVAIGAINDPGLLHLPLSTLATATTANVLAAILIRQELVINILFILAGRCPRWVPLRIRRLAAKIYHLGGVHSGASFAATVWFGVFSIVLFRTVPLEAGINAALRSITGILDTLLLAIIITSEPHFRRKYHNPWEWCQ